MATTGRLGAMRFIKFTIAFSVLFISFLAHSFEFTTDFAKGFYWQRFPIPIAVVESDATKKALLVKLLDEAIAEWETYSNIDLWTRVESSSNVVRWSEKFGVETGYPEVSTLGVTFRRITGPYVRTTEIILNTNHGLMGYPIHLRTVLIHELGHTLGLDHSYVNGAVMESSVTLNYHQLHADDIEGLHAVTGQTVHRQETGYVAPGSYSSESEFGPSCGTLTLGNDGGPGSGGQMLSLLLGMTLGLALLTKKSFKRA